MLACRACRKPLIAEQGCALCLDFKKQLVALDENDEEKPSLADVSSDVVNALRVIVRKGRELLRDEESFDKGTVLTLKAGNTAAKVLEAARKLQTDGLAAIRNMAFVERAELFITWYAALPPVYRMKLRDQLTKHEGETNRPRELPAGE